eukprot:CAMPEP_0117449398 /NCGR_PEP_ID=MMETSP0759-20121206/7926_1 /TAXON_ID=63605 /ORGANISM="Percolomonas cosmopolitus, Strain WS" /LENGTH=287 /DNA_ID=CAMNT_0005241875 /DNA_START=382 /DNA_END=1245 /DNA_ORIENTATION=+
MDFLPHFAHHHASVSPPSKRHRTPLEPQHRSPSAIRTHGLSGKARHESAVTLGNDKVNMHSISHDFRAYDPTVYAENKSTKLTNRLQGTRSSVSFSSSPTSNNNRAPNLMTSYTEATSEWRQREPLIADQVSRDAKQDASQFRHLNRASNVTMGFDSDKAGHLSTSKQSYDNPWKHLSPNSPNNNRVDRRSLSPFRRGEADDIKNVLSKSSVQVRSPHREPDPYMSSSTVAAQAITPEARSQAFQESRKNNVQLNKKHRTDVTFGDDSGDYRSASYAHLAHPGYVYA